VPPDAAPVPEIVCEGDTDSAAYDALVARDLLPALRVYPAKDDKKGGGIEKQNQRISAMLKSGRERLIVARDLDQHADGPALLKALSQDLGADAKVVSQEPALLLEVRGSRIALVPQGLAVSALLDGYGITRHAIDDYLLLLLHEDVDPRLALFKVEADRDRAFRKMDEVRKLMLSQGFTVTASKRLVFMLKAIADYGVSDATLARQSIERSKREVLTSAFGPLIETVNAAVQALV
jgi:hypothetical protein